MSELGEGREQIETEFPGASADLYWDAVLSVHDHVTDALAVFKPEDHDEIVRAFAGALSAFGADCSWTVTGRDDGSLTVQMLTRMITPAGTFELEAHTLLVTVRRADGTEVTAALGESQFRPLALRAAYELDAQV